MNYLSGILVDRQKNKRGSEYLMSRFSCKRTNLFLVINLVWLSGLAQAEPSKEPAVTPDYFLHSVGPAAIATGVGTVAAAQLWENHIQAKFAKHKPNLHLTSDIERLLKNNQKRGGHKSQIQLALEALKRHQQRQNRVPLKHQGAKSVSVLLGDSPGFRGGRILTAKSSAEMTEELAKAAATAQANAPDGKPGSLQIKTVESQMQYANRNTLGPRYTKLAGGAISAAGLLWSIYTLYTSVTSSTDLETLETPETAVQTKRFPGSLKQGAAQDRENQQTNSGYTTDNNVAAAQ